MPEQETGLAAEPVAFLLLVGPMAQRCQGACRALRFDVENPALVGKGMGEMLEGKQRLAIMESMA